MELALGTVQFGLAYGVAGNGGVVPAFQARQILAAAWEAGIRTLDTASVYGDIEQRLTSLCAAHDFNIISKIAPIPSGIDAATAATWVVAQAEQSRDRLGHRLKGLMFHRADDLLGPGAQQIWLALERWADPAQVELGVSCYDPVTCLRIQENLPIRIAQLPGNALDQRLPRAIPEPLPNLHIHLRSAFLQGLLLMEEAPAARRLSAAAPALRRWHAWCTRHGRSPLTAALSIVKSFRAVTTVLVGVDSMAQLHQITAAWANSDALLASELGEQSLDVIDPRLWKQ